MLLLDLPSPSNRDRRKPEMLRRGVRTKSASLTINFPNAESTIVQYHLHISRLPMLTLSLLLFPILSILLLLPTPDLPNLVQDNISI